MQRPFQGLASECDWVALREIVPAATAPVRLGTGAAEVAPGAAGGTGRDVVLATVLPLAWPAMVRGDGAVFVGLQVSGRSGDVSRDIAAALEQALVGPPGSAVTSTAVPGPGARLQDLLADEVLEVTVRDGFDFWVEGVPDPTGEVTASLERANASVVPTTRLTQVEAAYWCRIGTREHLRWVLPEDEDSALDALARLQLAGGLALGDGSRYVGAFRADGLLVPVWDVAPEGAEPLEEPAVAFRARLDAALAVTEPLDAAGRRARAGLVGRQVTLR